MKSIEVFEVVTKAQMREFVNFPLELYKNCKYFVPPLYADEMAIFSDDNAYSDTCESICFLAKIEKKTVGRIQGIIQRQYNEIHGEKRLRFSRFDSIDDVSVAKALFDAVEKWGIGKGLDTVCGPLGYSDLEREGLLIEGFDRCATFEEQYNFEYYAALIEACGYEKEIDWFEFQLRAPKRKTNVLKRVSDRVLESGKLHLVDPDSMSKKEYIDRYKDGFFECLDICYSHLYGTTPFTDKMKKQLVDQFMLVINKKYLIIICDENDRVVSFALCFPGFGTALQKSGGRLTPLAVLRMLKLINNPKVIDLGLVAVLPEYQAAGVNAVMLYKMTEYLENGGVEYFETNLNLETNTQVMSQWKYFDAEQHKKRRSYIKKLTKCE